MNPNTGEYVSLEGLKTLPANEAADFSVEVRGPEEDVQKLSDAVKAYNRPDVEQLYQGAIRKLRDLQAVGRKLEKSGHPAVQAAGRDILRATE